MTQEQAIMDHLRQGNKLTPLEALRLFNCLALSSRTSDLNKRGVKEGFRIGCKLVNINGKTVGQYSMEYDSDPSGQMVIV